jgi:hypothetical protein
MATIKNEGSGVLASPESNNFFYGKLMDVLQFEKDHRYFNFKRSLINRLVLGSGVVCGLNVVQDPQAEGRVLIQPGVAIDGLGREIVVTETASIDPHQLTDDRGNPAGTPLTSGTVTICLTYAETCADLVPVLVPDCDTPGNCAPSTIREGFHILVRPADPEPPVPPTCKLQPGESSFPAETPLHDLLNTLLCERINGSCPGPEVDSCEQLGRVTLDGEKISSIDSCAGRHFVYSNALLYELIVCLAERVKRLGG